MFHGYVGVFLDTVSEVETTQSAHCGQGSEEITKQVEEAAFCAQFFFAKKTLPGGWPGVQRKFLVGCLLTWPMAKLTKLFRITYLSWESKGTPPMPPPPGNKALLRDY